MIPRKQLDIDWSDLLFGMAQCFRNNNRTAIEDACKNATPAPNKAICFLSVRSGLDLLLQVLQFPKGSEVLISAITIPDIITILKAHHLVPVPIDLHPETLYPNTRDLETKITPKTVAIIATHLFGARIPMDEITHIAKLHSLLLFEDCAQGYWGDAYTGHPDSDVCMFSFGSIKLNTALGGALFFIRDSQLRRKAMQKHATYCIQKNNQFFQRVLKFTFIKILSQPWIYTLFCTLCRLLGISHDLVIFAFTRGFSGDELFQKLRQQPSDPLLALLQRRLTSNALQRTILRRQTAHTFRKRIPQILCPGYMQANTFWVFPILVSNPQELCEHLINKGFDAHGWPVSLHIVNANEPGTPHNALAIQKHILFIPIYPGLTQHQRNQLAHIICESAHPYIQTSQSIPSVGL